MEKVNTRNVGSVFNREIKLVFLSQQGMRLFEVFNYRNALRAFFFTFKAFDTVVGLVVS